MSAIRYLDIPKLLIPEDFYCSNVYYQSKASSGYKSYVLGDIRVLDQIRAIFPNCILSIIEGIFLQEINPGFNQKIHVDPRTIAINYILETGGETETYFLYPPESIRLEPNVWHWFYANKPHAVKKRFKFKKIYYHDY